MKAIVFALAVMFCSSHVFAAGPPLFKEFIYGQSRPDLLKVPGVEICDEVVKDALCRDKQSFSGFDDWIQVLMFSNGKLALVAMSGAKEDSRYTKVVGTLLQGGYTPLVMQSGPKTFDGLTVMHEKGAKEFESAFVGFEASALNSGVPLTYTFVQNDVVKKSPKSKTFFELLRDADNNMRTVELVIDDSNIIVRFLAPKAALGDQLEQMKKQKENF
jgi:hypothetical protein